MEEANNSVILLSHGKELGRGGINHLPHLILSWAPCLAKNPGTRLAQSIRRRDSAASTVQGKSRVKL